MIRRTQKLISEPAITWSLGVFFGVRLLLSALGVALWLMDMVPTTPDPVTRPYFGISPVVEGSAGYLLGVWQRFDAIHYLRIASEGYSTVHLSAFLPLYPLSIRLTGTVVGGDILLGAMAVSNLACLLLLMVLYKLIVEEDLGVDVARRSSIYLLLFPTAFFLLAPYTESLFLLLSVISFREARCGRWTWASLASLAAALTRLQGICLVFVLGLEMLRQAEWQPQRVGWRFTLAFSPAFGLGAFLAWRLWSGFPFITELQASSWARIPACPWQGITMTFQRILEGSIFSIEYLDLVVTLLMLGLGAMIIRRLPLSYGLYFWSALLFNLSQVRVVQPLSGQARFCLTLFPAFIILAQLGRSSWFNRLILYPSTALWLFFAGQFIMWGWVG